jgi:hypothetical protein
VDEELARTFLQPGSEAWAVYADELQTRGDPRGELIAIELELDGELPTEERERLEVAAAPLREQFTAALARRLAGAGIEAGVAATWRFGFLRSVNVERSFELHERLASVFAGDEARFLCALAIDASPHRQPRKPVGATAVDRLARALPCLRTLTLIGREVFESLEHPSLESLHIRGHDAIVELDRVNLPRLVELEYTLMPGPLLEQIYRVTDLDPDPYRFTAALHGPAMPALRRLDLSRNNPGAREYSVYREGEDPGVLFEALALDVTSRLEELVLPTATEAQIVSAREALARVPRLRMPRLYPRTSGVSAGRLRELLPNLEIADEYRHPHAGEIYGREVMRIQTNPCSKNNFVWVGFARIAKILESRWDALSSVSRACFDELIDSFGGLEYAEDYIVRGPREQMMPVIPLHSAVSELVRGAEQVDDRIQRLVDLLERHVDCCETITLKKIWGWNEEL